MTTVRITYFGMEGEGRTLTEAKRDAGAKIEAALSGYWTPEILTHRGYAILVYREPTGWHERIIADPEDGVRAGSVWGNSHDGTKEEAVCCALAHLADLGWTPEDGEEPPPFLKDKASISEFKYKARFRLRYKEGRARGLSDNEAHSYAGRNPVMDSAFWERCAALGLSA